MFHTFEELIDSDKQALIGKKALSLVELTGMGVAVPEGGVITIGALDEFLRLNGLSEAKTELLKVLQDQGTTLEQEVVEEKLKRFRDALMKGAVSEELMSRLSQFTARYAGDHFAIRSSGTKEDLADASFAGLYESVLNVRGDEHIRSAVKRCWSSLFQYRVIHYCLERSIALDSLSLGLVVQRMIPSEESGVVFSVNPITGNDTQMVIEACFGLGEALVSGAVTPDQYYYDWYSDTLVEENVQEKQIAIRPIDEAPFTHTEQLSPDEANRRVLSMEALRELSACVVRIQASYGFPVDVEWARCGGAIYIVQSRPITSINYSGIEGEWTTADFKDGGVSSTVCSQFMWSLYDYVWEGTMPAYLKQTKLINESVSAVWGRMFFGRPYWNIGEVKNGLRRLPGFRERSFDEDLGIEITYEGDGYVTPTTPRSLWAGIKVLTALDKAFKEQEEVWRPFIEEQDKRLKELDSLDIDAMPREELFRFYETFIEEEYYRSESTYFIDIFNNSNFTTLFKEAFVKIKGDFNYLTLISGLTDLSHLKFNYALWDLGRAINEDDGAREYWESASVPELVAAWRQGSQTHAMPEAAILIEEFKYHSTRELDITVPRFGEDPSFVMDSIRVNISLGPELDPRKLNSKQQAAYEAEKKKFVAGVGPFSRGKMRKKLERLREFLWWREELRDYSTQYYYHARRFTLGLIPHLVELGLLDSAETGRSCAPESGELHADDIFFLPKDDLLALLRGELSINEVRQRLLKNRLYYKSFRLFTNPDEIGKRFSGGTAGRVVVDGNQLVGVPCSGGVVTGKARVIRDIFDANRLEQGDILITRFTDPGWTPKFSLISAVATETGGLLSHAAVISREYGIPAVLAIKGLTEIIRDGQEITVDGDSGVVIMEDG